MEAKKQGVPAGKIFLALVALLVLVICTAIVTLLISQHFYRENFCGATKRVQKYESPSLIFPKEEEWQAAERLHLPHKKLVVIRPEVDERCFLVQKAKQEEKGKARPLVLIHESLTEEMMDEMAGPNAVEFCADRETFMLRELREEETNPARIKRQVHGIELPYEQRTPRCVDIILDCSLDGNIGQVQSCYTWINGVLQMVRECKEPNKFSIHMSKPPGRILKIFQKEMIKCLAEYRPKGLRC